MLKVYLVILAIWIINANRQQLKNLIQGKTDVEISTDNLVGIKKDIEELQNLMQILPEGIIKLGPVFTAVIMWVNVLLSLSYFILAMSVIKAPVYLIVSSLLLAANVHTEAVIAKYFIHIFKKKDDQIKTGTPWGSKLGLANTIHGIITIIVLIIG